MATSTRGVSPEIPDPYVGTVYGNILDMYDNPSYNLKMYMMPKSEWFTTKKAQAGATSTSGSARSDTPSTSTDNKTPVVPKTVVIAQTGVTGVVMDDLTFEMAPHTSGGFNTTKMTFRIIQPGGANILDQIIAADKFLGNEITTSPVFFVDITFKGYRTDPDDNDAGGEVTTILGPITYQCKLNKIAVKIDNTGSSYDCEAQVQETIAFTDQIYRVPATLSSVGKTITEHVKSFEKSLNDYYLAISTSYERPDEIKFDLSGLIGEGGAAFEGGDVIKIKDDTLNTSNNKEAEDINRAWTNLTNETVEQEQQSAETPPKNTGKVDIVVEGDNIKVTKGWTFDRYFFVLLSMNQEFLNMITRKTNFSDPGDSSVNKAKTFISWMRMNAEVEDLQWDKKRGAYTKRYIYKPTLYNTGRSDVLLTIDEVDVSGSEAAATRKLQGFYGAGQLHKSYYYIFSGRNDQILNIDIAYEAGATLLVPPKGGALGDVSITSAVALNSTVAANADASGGTIFNKAKNAANKAKFGDLLSSIKDTAASVNSIAGAIGRSPDQLRTILNDTTGKAQRDLVNALDSRTINRVASAAAMSNTSSSPTDQPAGSTPGGAPYTPEKSGFVYSEDLVMSSDAVTTDDLKNSKIDVDLRYEVLGTSTVPNIAEAATYVTTNPGNTLFGYVYQQHTSSAFLNKVQMTIRGDPWYLGKGEMTKNMSEKSSPAVMSYKGNDNLFILQIAAAKSYDPAVDDEDNLKNSGYWNFDGMSNSFSGLFRITKVVNNFRNGIYTVDVEATKDMAVPLNKIRRVRVNEKPRDLTSVAGYDAAAKTLGTPASEVGVTPPGDPFQPGLVGAPPKAGSANMAGLRDWLQAQGAVADENPNFPGDYNANVHSSNEHREGRAFDVNLKAGDDSKDPVLGPKMDKIEAALRAQGWQVVWRKAGHFDHLHVYHLRGQ